MDHIPGLSGKRGSPLQVLVGRDHLLQFRFVRAVAAVAIGMIAADEFAVAFAECRPVGVRAEPEDAQRAPFAVGQHAAVLARCRHPLAEARADRVRAVGQALEPAAGSRRRVADAVVANLDHKAVAAVGGDQLEERLGDAVRDAGDPRLRPRAATPADRPGVVS